MNDSLKILLVEDEDVLREELALNLRLEGFEVLQASSADEGLRMAKAHEPAAVVTDIRMPRKPGDAEDGPVGGYELIQHLRMAVGPLGMLMPVIVLSAYGDTSDRISALEHGADGHVTKASGAEIELVTAYVRATLARFSEIRAALASAG